MSKHVYKLIELVGSSTTGTDDAIRNAIETAALTLRHIDWFEVLETRGHVVDGRIGHYQVTLKVGFRLAPEEEGEGIAGGQQESGAIGIVAGRA
jgi:flavin-binding protein dodecin